MPGSSTSSSGSSRAARAAAGTADGDSLGTAPGGTGSAGPKPTGRRWGELHGQLRSQILQASPASYRGEYAHQIEQHFRILAEPPGDLICPSP